MNKWSKLLIWSYNGYAVCWSLRFIIQEYLYYLEILIFDDDVNNTCWGLDVIFAGSLCISYIYILELCWMIIDVVFTFLFGLMLNLH